MAKPRIAKGQPASPKPKACIAADCGEPLFGGPPFCAYCGAAQATPEPVVSPPPPPEPASPPPPSRKGPWSAPADQAEAARPPVAEKPAPPAAKSDGRPTFKPVSFKPTPLRLDLTESTPAPVVPKAIVGIPKEKKGGCGTWLVGLGLFFIVITILAAITEGSESPNIETLYVTRPVSVRAQAAARGEEPLDTMVRGAEVKGEWVTEEGGTERWLKLSEGPYTGRYLWGRNLSSRARPALSATLDEKRRLSTSAALYEEPDKTSSILENVAAKTQVALVGQTETGWWEAIRTDGGVGYLEPDVFSQSSAASREKDDALALPTKARNKGAASFDCNSARNLVEQTICSDPRLSQADRDLAALYGEALVIGGDPVTVRSEQRAWIRRRNAGSADASRLLQLYEARAAELRLDKQTPPPQPAVAGRTTKSVMVESRDWIRRASEEDFQRYYPERALRLGIEGRAVITCTVTARGALGDCRILEESPPGHDFGSAALRLSKLYRMQPRTVDGLPVSGGQVKIQMGFELPKE